LRRLQKLGTDFPDSPEVTRLRQDVQMLRLRDVGFSADDQIGDAPAREAFATLSKDLTRAPGEHVANLEAHLGWVESLRQRSGVAGLDPVPHYRRALELEPPNVYAHAMWGFDILRQRGSLAEAKQHFAAAVESGKDGKYVRRLQIAALLWNPPARVVNVADRRGVSQERKNEAIRVANEMRINKEPLPGDWGEGSIKRNMWRIYLFDAGSQERPFLSALPPEEHLRTFHYLFWMTGLPKDPEFLLISYFIEAQLHERSGDRKNALASYHRTRREFESKRFDNPSLTTIAGEADAAIKRLSN
jgi:hypothetical protein